MILICNHWLDRVNIDGNWSNRSISNSRHHGVNINIRHHNDIYWWKLGYISMNQFVILFGFHARWKKNLPRCMFISSTPIFSGLQSSPTVDSQSLNILMSLSVLHFVLTIISAVSVCCLLPCLSCLLTRHNDVIDACLLTRHNDVIDACLPRALIWIGHFVYHTFKKVRFSYKYGINYIYIYIYIYINV
jgi:hypothetical protein